jgi:hypothetical protein
MLAKGTAMLEDVEELPDCDELLEEDLTIVDPYD